MQTINILAAGLFFAGPTFWSAILLFELFHITFVKISSVNCRAFLALFSPFFTYLLSQQIDTGPRHLKPAVIYSHVACGITRSPTHTQTTPLQPDVVLSSMSLVHPVGQQWYCRILTPIKDSVKTS